MSEKSIFSENLKKARKMKGWSQEAAAAAIRKSGATHFNRPMLGSYEEDRARPTNETFVIICTVYGIEDVKAFITDEGFFDKRATPEELHRRYHLLDGPTKRAVEILLGLTC